MAPNRLRSRSTPRHRWSTTFKRARHPAPTSVTDNPRAMHRRCPQWPEPFRHPDEFPRRYRRRLGASAYCSAILNQAVDAALRERALLGEVVEHLVELIVAEPVGHCARDRRERVVG